MEARDEKGFIYYTTEELNSVPPFEVREKAGAYPCPGGALGMLGGAGLGAAIGSAFGPAGTVIGGLAGGAAGGAVGRGTESRAEDDEQRNR